MKEEKSADMLGPKEILECYYSFWISPHPDFSKLPCISIQSIVNLCQVSISHFREQSIYIELGCPLVIVGDIHGSLIDLCRVFRVFDVPPITNYLFLGDYVDRGQYSLPVITILLALFCQYPEKMTLLRGNHEFSHINKNYGFLAEIMDKYKDESLWELFQEVFSYMPLVAIVNEQIFCVHGGLSPKLTDLYQIQIIDIPLQTYMHSPLVSDLVWSDPSDNIAEFSRNIRGSGHIFGSDTVERFLKNNKLKLMIRAHQCVAQGVCGFADFCGITVFSCSNYGGIMKNRCGAIKIGEDEKVYLYSIGSDDSNKIKPQSIMQLQQTKLGLRKAAIHRMVPVKLPDKKKVKANKPLVKQIRATTPPNHPPTKQIQEIPAVVLLKSNPDFSPITVKEDMEIIKPRLIRKEKSKNSLIEPLPLKKSLSSKDSIMDKKIPLAKPKSRPQSPKRPPQKVIAAPRPTKTSDTTKRKTNSLRIN